MRSRLVREKIRWPARELDDGIWRDYCTGELASQKRVETALGVQRTEPSAITRGASVAYIGGTMAVASLSAQLYLLTGATNYLSVMLQTRTFLRPSSNLGLSGNVHRDVWSDGIFAQNFADDVLSLAGVDKSGVFKAAFIDTAQSIIDQRIPVGFYDADWSSPDELVQSGPPCASAAHRLNFGQP